jgi:hypothetical protein
MRTKLLGANFLWIMEGVLILLARVRIKMASVGTRRKVYSVKKSTITTESLGMLSL